MILSKSKRCDNLLDCLDNSDEESCTFISLPKTYNPKLPPIQVAARPVEVSLHVAVLRLYSIDTISMRFSVQIALTRVWKDYRIGYKNIKDKQDILSHLSSG